MSDEAVGVRSYGQRQAVNASTLRQDRLKIGTDIGGKRGIQVGRTKTVQEREPTSRGGKARAILGVTATGSHGSAHEPLASWNVSASPTPTSGAHELQRFLEKAS
jgi:hypothetical protein